MSQPGHIRIDRYEVRERIGQGGMGTLYLALDPAIDRLVALKLLRAPDEELHARFVREAKSAGRLQHPNIVTIYDVGDHEGQPFIAMEYIAGETLQEIIARHAPLPLARKLELLDELCLGLSYAHAAGVVHRDIKPANLIVSREGHLKILDFGIARMRTATQKKSGTVVGTPSYMAPEQLRGESVDQRADIFSVGVVSYELFSYHRAFAGDSVIEVLDKIEKEPPPPLETLVPDLAPALVAIVDRALRKSRDERYPTLADMAADLKRVYEDLDTAELSVSLATPARNARTDRGAFVARRRAKVDALLQTARTALDSGGLDDARTAAEEAATIDPDHTPTLDLLDAIRNATDAHAAQRQLEQAGAQFAAGEITAAEILVARAADLDETAAAPVRARIQAVRRERDAAAAANAPDTIPAVPSDDSDAATVLVPPPLPIVATALPQVPSVPPVPVPILPAPLAADATAPLPSSQTQADDTDAPQRLPGPPPTMSGEPGGVEALPSPPAPPVAMDDPQEPWRTAAPPPMPPPGGVMVVPPSPRMRQGLTLAQVALLLIALVAVFVLAGWGALRFLSSGPADETTASTTDQTPTESPATPANEPSAATRATETPSAEKVPGDTTPGQLPDAPATAVNPDTPPASQVAADTGTPQSGDPKVIDALLGTARDLVRKGRLEEALRVSLHASSTGGGEPATKMVASVVAAGAARARTAREAATQVEGADQLRPFRDAVAQEREAQRSAAAPTQALGQYLNAERGFTQAATERRAALEKDSAASRELTAWVAAQMASGRDAATRQQWDEALRIYREVARRAPRTPGLDVAMANAEREQARIVAEHAVASAVAAARSAIARDQWDEAAQALASFPAGDAAPADVRAVRAQIDRHRSEVESRARLSAGDLQRDDQAIGRLMRAWEQAFERRNVDDVKALWPGLDGAREDGLRAAFGTYERQSVDMDCEKTTRWQAGFSVASRRCDISLDVRLKDGKRNKKKFEAQEFRFERRDGVWVIVAAPAPH